MRAYEFELEGLSVHRAVDRLTREGIEVISARRTQKNGMKVAVNAQDRKKAFAILQGSCYNIKNMRASGMLRVLETARRAVGLLAGTAVALGAVLFLQSRVLRIDVTGSGAYLEPEIRAVLREEGIGYFSEISAAQALVPKLLTLPRVDFCTVKGEGGILTVHVEVSDPRVPLAEEPLLSPADGIVEELVVLRGTPAVQVGDSVVRGQRIVENFVLRGEEKVLCLVVARVRVAFPVSAEYPLDEERAKLQACLEFGELTDMQTTKTADGWRVEGTGHAEGILNFG